MNMADAQRTFVMVKPDGVKRRLIGEVVRRIEAKGYEIREMKLFTIDESLAQKHYAEHTEKPFFGELVSFITRGPALLLVVEGPGDTWKVVRTMMGVTNPKDAAPGTIRGDYGLLVTENLVHGSDGPESAEREIAIFFPGL